MGPSVEEPQGTVLAHLSMTGEGRGRGGDSGSPYRRGRHACAHSSPRSKEASCSNQALPKAPMAGPAVDRGTRSPVLPLAHCCGDTFAGNFCIYFCYIWYQNALPSCFRCPALPFPSCHILDRTFPSPGRTAVPLSGWGSVPYPGRWRSTGPCIAPLVLPCSQAGIAPLFPRALCP